MKILIVNANSSAAVTDLLLGSARAIAAPGTEVEAVTAPFGPAYIVSRTEMQIAGYATLVGIARHGGDADGIMVGCFGDPGIQAARELVPVPVIGMAEAAMAVAAFRGQRFSIITGGAAWRPILTELAASLGHERRLASIRTTVKSAGDYAGDAAAALADLRALALSCIEEDGADVVIPGGAGFAGLLGPLAEALPVPVIDPMVASLGLLELLVRQGGAKRRSVFGPAIGLDPALAAAMGQQLGR
jgi:Asp/Glu/hydantoin racemase